MTTLWTDADQTGYGFYILQLQYECRKSMSQIDIALASHADVWFAPVNVPASFNDKISSTNLGGQNVVCEFYR